MAGEIEELEQTIKAANRKLCAIRDAERAAENAKLVGKCFRYRNNYSLPEGPKDGWWLYGKALRVTENGSLIMHQFQTDKYGNLDVKFDETKYYHMNGWQPISAGEFTKAWRAVQKKIASTTP